MLGVIEYDLNEFESKFRDKNLGFIESYLIGKRNQLESIMEGSFNQVRFIINIRGYRAVFKVREGKIMVWTSGGSILVYERETFKLKVRYIRQIEKIVKNLINDIYPCSRCGDLITKDDIAGVYYGGVYCEDCWEKKGKSGKSIKDMEEEDMHN